ncbi:MAG TPA: AMP-binding protein [Flavobacterium sp.]|nr:AMP-binding protein [Flavobacterium sp.]
MNWTHIHPDFKLNGQTYTIAEFTTLAQQYLQSTQENERDFGQLILDWFDESPLMAVQTSGTTGTPKLIDIDKQHMINSARATTDFFDLQARDSALLCMPVKYIAGKMMWIRALVSGLHIDMVNPSSKPLQNTQKHYNFVAMVPLQVENSLSELHRVKKLLIGGAKLDDSLRKKLLELPTACYETYAMTETVTHIAAKKIEEPHFSALPNVSFSTDNRTCLVIDAPNVSRQTITTNDIVRLIDDKHFEWLGRIDNVINSGGVKIFPEKIENILADKISQRFFIAGMPDKHLGEKVILVIEGISSPIDDSIFESLHPYERPKNIFFVQQFAETPTGKIKRKQIVEKLVN